MYKLQNSYTAHSSVKKIENKQLRNNPKNLQVLELATLKSSTATQCLEGWMNLEHKQIPDAFYRSLFSFPD